jgi:hypothetical protein
MPSKKAVAKRPPKLTKTEEDLLWHLTHGFQLETDSFGTGLLLRNLKDNSVVRTASANQSTIRALEERGLISAKTDGLTTIWWAKNKPGKVKPSVN